MTLHNVLANAELHEDKDVSTAADGEVYFSDGAGSGDHSPLVATAGSWTYSSDTTSIEFTGLDDYAILELTLSDIQLDSETNQNIVLQVGSDAGYTTSSVYYGNSWHSGGENTTNTNGLVLGDYKTSTSPFISFINASTSLITNFNVERYLISATHQMFPDTTSTTAAWRNRIGWVRERAKYNKIRIRSDNLDNFTAGSITVGGYYYKV